MTTPMRPISEAMREKVKQSAADLAEAWAKSGDTLEHYDRRAMDELRDLIEIRIMAVLSSKRGEGLRA
ncbi:hypothetical protein ACVMGC_011516 [Bradyrhizobium barranii subsp. barranii]|uniref:Uncharacterized protein n=1 Tax=Bradyrhizobium barranii subsp. barranii TaxID=2823807 RepID=A0A939M8B4_9BRAD|nr:hypothetical protein [Bradyrhizobium barranii]UEM08580.1 hypothetical protein J4G43_027810 [Bradyrhizobium barranii subsp. barranii]